MLQAVNNNFDQNSLDRVQKPAKQSSTFSAVQKSQKSTNNMRPSSNMNAKRNQANPAMRQSVIVQNQTNNTMLQNVYGDNGQLTNVATAGSNNATTSKANKRTSSLKDNHLKQQMHAASNNMLINNQALSN